MLIILGIVKSNTRKVMNGVIIVYVMEYLFPEYKFHERCVLVFVCKLIYYFCFLYYVSVLTNNVNYDYTGYCKAMISNYFIETKFPNCLTNNLFATLLNPFDSYRNLN